ncbi:Hypothetical_protein [Hexamita inflata]|uniref:Hypothetical_protein n=1 Tax=Hexamita inflata TaxID=28002 RepID=A0AA86U0J8_9EUKA|nr:Hypothetical protein HINF_LOCUS24795 [Hexamita inflata]
MEWTLNSNPVIVTPKVFQNDNQKFQIIVEKALIPAPHPKRYQSTFLNLKIQFGVQILNSGSLLIIFTTLINQMYIISKQDTTLTVNTVSQLNIISQSSTNASITNLQVDLAFNLSYEILLQLAQQAVILISRDIKFSELISALKLSL